MDLASNGEVFATKHLRLKFRHNGLTLTMKAWDMGHHAEALRAGCAVYGGGRSVFCEYGVFAVVGNVEKFFGLGELTKEKYSVTVFQVSTFIVMSGNDANNEY